MVPPTVLAAPAAWWSRQRLAAWPLLVALTVTGITVGCGGRVPLQGGRVPDGGFVDGGVDYGINVDSGFDGSSSCYGLDEPQCSVRQECSYVYCSGCQGESSGACQPSDQPVACPAIDCVGCQNLDEKTCSFSNCNATYCLDCFSQTTYFAGCTDPGGPQITCPAEECPMDSCQFYDQDTCDQLVDLGCKSVYCPTCRGEEQYQGCYGPNDGFPGCPPVACEECYGLDEFSCYERPDCRADYCSDCSSAYFTGCNRVDDPFPSCPRPACNDCNFRDENSCSADMNCFPVYCPDCTRSGFQGCYGYNEPVPECPPPPPCPPPPFCSSLDQASCHQFPECRPRYCPNCDGSGQTTYQGCFDRNAPAPPCARPPRCPEARCGSFDETGCRNSDVCHPVYVDYGAACDCAEPGCCTFFSFCAPGKFANCGGPLYCSRPAPLCEGAYAVSYRDGCYEGCVETFSECTFE